jgi:hypothetical protein
MTDRSDGYPWWKVDGTGWRLDEEYRGYMTEGWVTPRWRASVIKEMMDEMDGIIAEIFPAAGDGW